MRPLKIRLSLFAAMAFPLGVFAVDYVPLPEFVEVHTAAKGGSNALLIRMQETVTSARAEISELEASVAQSVEKIVEQERKITALNARIAELEAKPVSGGWLAEFFPNKTRTGTPVRVETVQTVGGNWGDQSPEGLPVDNFSIRYTGRFPFKGGSTTFWVRAGDGVRVWLDGVLIIDQWRNQSARNYSVTRQVAAGEHEVRVEYYENTSAAELWFAWE